MTLVDFLAEHGEGLLPGVSVTLRQLHHQKSHPSMDDNFPTVAQRKSLLQLTVCLLYIIAIPETTGSHKLLQNILVVDGRSKKE